MPGPAEPRFVALGPIGAAPQSRAFLGYETDGERALWPVVAIWVPTEVQEDPDRLAQLVEDTRRAAEIDHASVLRVLGCERLDEGFARVVELADGETLRRVLEGVRRAGRPGLSPAVAARAIADACAGVHHVHELGQREGNVRARLHGAIRPETLIVGFDGHTKVSGYGALAVAPRDAFGARLSSRYLYLSPEEVEGGASAADRRGDVYAMGVALYEALSGQTPFLLSDPDFEAHVLSVPPPPEPLSRVPPVLREIVLQALAKSPGERFATVGQLGAALTSFGCAPHEEVARDLDRLFPEDGDARAARARMLEAVGLGPPPWPRPPAAKPAPPAVKAAPAAAPTPLAPTPVPAEVAPAPMVAAIAPSPPVAPPAPVAAAVAPPPAPAPSPKPPAAKGTRAAGSRAKAPDPDATDDIGGRRHMAPALILSALAGAGLVGGVGYFGFGPRAAAPPAAPRASPPALPAAPLTATPLVPAGSPLGSDDDLDRDDRPLPTPPVKRRPAPKPRPPARNAGMEITAPSGSRIFLDGRPVGVAPVSPLHFTSGSHHIKVLMGKAKFERQFFAQQGETLTLEVHPTESP
ncbi:MAG: protein kinase domain-containing protein [Deltaproteobacteria bacterium]